MELFSRRIRMLASGQLSNKFGYSPSWTLLIFLQFYKHKSVPCVSNTILHLLLLNCSRPQVTNSLLCTSHHLLDTVHSYGQKCFIELFPVVSFCLLLSSSSSFPIPFVPLSLFFLLPIFSSSPIPSEEISVSRPPFSFWDQHINSNSFICTWTTKATKLTNSESTHHRGKHHCLADLLFDWFGFNQTKQICC